MAKSFTVDDTRFRMQARNLIRKLKLDEPKVVKEQAGLLAQLQAKMTPPFKSFPAMKGRPTYATAGALAQGVKATTAGFFSAVKKVGSDRAWKSESIQKAIRSGNIQRLNAIFKNAKKSNKYGLEARRYTDNARNRKRDNRGRVNKGTAPFIGITTAAVNAGLDRAIKSVGIAKAAFAKAAYRLGRKSPPRWISRHFSKIRTTVIFTKNPTRIKYTANAKGLDVVSRNLKRIERFRLQAMVARLKSLVRAESKKKGFRVR
jgi:hypothetical protein